VLIAVNARSVGLFGSIEYAFSLVKVIAIMAFIVLAGCVLFRARGAAVGQGAEAIGFRNYTAYGGFLPHGIAGMWVAVIMAVFSYLSIEMIAVAAGEASDPETAVVRAFRSTVLRLTLFYLLTIALMLALLPWTQAGAATSPFVAVMRSLNIPGAAGVMNFVILIAALSAMNSQLYITSRMLFSPSRAGQAPAALGAVTARGSPVLALLVSSAGVAVAAAVSLAAPQGAFIGMVAIACFGALFTWLMIFITHYRFRRARLRAGVAASGFALWGFPGTTLLGAGLMAALLATTPFTAAFRMTLVFGVPFLAVLAAPYGLREWRTPRATALSGS
jgi:L-asparagine transporter-like permease